MVYFRDMKTKIIFQISQNLAILLFIIKKESYEYTWKNVGRSWTTYEK